LIAPLSHQIGFHPDFSLDNFLEQTGLMATNIHPVNIFNFCTMVEAKNIKENNLEMRHASIKSQHDFHDNA